MLSVHKSSRLFIGRRREFEGIGNGRTIGRFDVRSRRTRACFAGHCCGEPTLSLNAAERRVTAQIDYTNVIDVQRRIVRCELSLRHSLRSFGRPNRGALRCSRGGLEGFTVSASTAGGAEEEEERRQQPQ